MRSPYNALRLNWNNCPCGMIKSLVFEKFAQCLFPNLISMAVVHGAAHSYNQVTVSCYHPSFCLPLTREPHMHFPFIYFSLAQRSISSYGIDFPNFPHNSSECNLGGCKAFLTATTYLYILPVNIV